MMHLKMSTQQKYILLSLSFDLVRGERKMKKLFTAFFHWFSLLFVGCATHKNKHARSVLRMKGLFRDRTEDAVSAFLKCINLNLETETAINAGKALARLGKL